MSVHAMPRALMRSPLTIGLTVTAVAVALLPGASQRMTMMELQHGRSVLQFFTCHLSHFTGDQLFWDALVFLCLGVACEQRSATAFRATLLLSAMVIPMAVLQFAPEVASYRGLSGIDSALFALLLTLEWRRNVAVPFCAAGFAAKIAFEMATASTLFVSGSSAFVPVPVAHTTGALAGLCIGLLTLLVGAAPAREHVVTSR